MINFTDKMRGATTYVLLTGLLLLVSLVEVTYSNLDKRDPESRPRKVTAYVEDANTISLTWDPPPRESDDGCQVKRYRIRVKHDGDSIYKTWKVDGEQTSSRIHDLAQDSDYAIRLNAVTCERQRVRTRWIKINTGNLGTAKTEPWLEEFPGVDNDDEDEDVPGKPTAVKTRTFSRSVLVTWRPPVEGEAVRGYKVGYSQNVPNLYWRYVDAAQRNITLDGLRPSTQYVISLCAYNKIGEGPVIYEIIYTKAETVESKPAQSSFVPPTNLRAKVLSSTSAWLQWSDPTLDTGTQILDNRYYNVQYQALSSTKSLSVIVKALHVVLYDLVPGTTYEFKVRTMKAQKYTPFSYTIRNRTYEAVPATPPRQVEVQTNNQTNKVWIAWRPPKQPNGIITDYQIMYTTDQRLPEFHWNLHSASGTETTVALPNLKPATMYYFKVQARNSQGVSPHSSIISFLTASSSSPQAKELEPRKAYESEVDYSDQKAETAKHENLQSQYDAAKFEALVQPEGQNSVESIKPEKPVLTTNLSPENDKKFMTQVQSDDSKIFTPTSSTKDSLGVRTAALKHEPVDPYDIPMEDDWRASSNFVHPPLEATFQSLVRYSVSAVLKWDEPCYSRPGNAVEYLIRYYLADDVGSYMEKRSPTNFAILDNLKPNSFYGFKVKRFSNNKEQTGWSEEGTFVTNYPHA